MSAKSKVLIAGAGLGGLTAALACLKYGFDVEVFEQAPSLGEVGAGVQISPSGFRVLNALCLKDQILESCFNPVGREMLVWTTGYRTFTPARSDEVIARYGHPHVTMHRADLHSILAEALKERTAEAVHVNAKACGYEQTEDGVTVNLAYGRTLQVELLVGQSGQTQMIRR